MLQERRTRRSANQRVYLAPVQRYVLQFMGIQNRSAAPIRILKQRRSGGHLHRLRGHPYFQLEIQIEGPAGFERDIILLSRLKARRGRAHRVRPRQDVGNIVSSRSRSFGSIFLLCAVVDRLHSGVRDHSPCPSAWRGTPVRAYRISCTTTTRITKEQDVLLIDSSLSHSLLVFAYPMVLEGPHTHAKRR